jgi:hypothetical protein
VGEALAGDRQEVGEYSPLRRGGHGENK